MIDWNRVTPGASVARRTLLGGILASLHVPARREYVPVVSAPAEVTAPVNTLPDARFEHTLTMLPDGRRLVAGGFDRGPLSSIQIFDSKSNSWSDAGSLNIPRHLHTATLLPDGKVLIAGGISCGVLTETEIFDPETGRCSLAPSMNLARRGHYADLLANGVVMVSGGTYLNMLAGAELFDGTSWSLA